MPVQRFFSAKWMQNDIKHKVGNGWEWCGYPYPRKEIGPNMPHVCEQPPSTVGQRDPSCAKLLSNTEKQGWNQVGDLLSICLCFFILCEICIGSYYMWAFARYTFLCWRLVYTVHLHPDNGVEHTHFFLLDGFLGGFHTCSNLPLTFRISNRKAGQ